MRRWIDFVEGAKVVIGVLSLIALVVFFIIIAVGDVSAEPPFEGNLLPGWDCQTPMALTSGSLPNSVLVAYRTPKGEWIYQQFGQTSLKKGRPFFSEFCPRGIPLPPPTATAS